MRCRSSFTPGAAPEPERVRRDRGARQGGVRAGGLRHVSHAAAVHEQHAHASARVHRACRHISATYDVLRVSVGTDPRLTLQTRRGTGYYKVPSLKGVWYRGAVRAQRLGRVARGLVRPAAAEGRLRADGVPRRRRQDARRQGTRLRPQSVVRRPRRADSVSQNDLTQVDSGRCRDLNA